MEEAVGGEERGRGEERESGEREREEEGKVGSIVEKGGGGTEVSLSLPLPFAGGRREGGESSNMGQTKPRERRRGGEWR